MMNRAFDLVTVQGMQKIDLEPGSNMLFIAAKSIETPLGTMIAAATDSGICSLEFSDCRMLDHNYKQICKRFDLPILPGTNKLLDELQSELHSYFKGLLKYFTVPLQMVGTPFQERAWNELLKIPYGKTISYEEQARRMGNANAVRAVGRANGMNLINILIPCHRVVGKDGQLTGYGGGLWRKRLLLELERAGNLPVKES